MGVLAADALGEFRPKPNGAQDESHQEYEVPGRFSRPQRVRVGVAEPLLGRIADMADLLDGGMNVEPEQIAEGIELWETYLHGNRWERLSVLADPPVSSCTEAVGVARENHERAPERMTRLRALLEAYSAGLPNARGELVLGLRSEVLVDRAWGCFQERHLFSSPSGRLSPATNERTTRALARDLKETSALEEKVQQYLARGVAIRSNPREIRRGIASGASRTAAPWASVPDEGVLTSQPGNGCVPGTQDLGGTGSPVPSSRGTLFPSGAVALTRGTIPHPDGALEELHQEHEVAGRLLERLMEIGEQIQEGYWVDAKTVRFGVGLLEAYLHRVHASQEDRELRTEVQRMPARDCCEHVNRMRADHEEMRQRAWELLELTRRWTSGDESCRSAVGDGLIELASKDHEVAAYEERHALTCLKTALPEDANHRLSDRFADHAGTRAALERNVERFLSYTGAIRMIP
jgi:hemerythrin-like domain-containing protein